MDRVVDWSEGLNISAKLSGVNLRGTHGWVYSGMWWVEDGVAGVAIQTRKFFGMFPRNFHAREVKGPITLWTSNCLFSPWACLAVAMTALGRVLKAISLLPVCWQALASVKGYRFKLNDIITGRYTGTTVWEPLLTGTAFNYCCFFGLITWSAFAILSRHCKVLLQASLPVTTHLYTENKLAEMTSNLRLSEQR